MNELRLYNLQLNNTAEDEDGSIWVRVTLSETSLPPKCSLCGEEFLDGWICVSSDKAACLEEVVIE